MPPALIYAKPGLVRIQCVSELPLPEDPLLREVADATDRIGPHMAGITLCHRICIAQRHANVRLIFP